MIIVSQFVYSHYRIQWANYLLSLYTENTFRIFLIFGYSTKGLSELHSCCLCTLVKVGVYNKAVNGSRALWKWNHSVSYKKQNWNHRSSSPLNCSGNVRAITFLLHLSFTSFTVKQLKNLSKLHCSESSEKLVFAHKKPIMDNHNNFAYIKN